MFRRSLVRSVLLSGVFFLSSQIAFAIPEKDTGNLGEIRSSILSVSNFQRIYGTGWVEMRGQNIENSDLYREGLWSERRLPDARGRFFRTFNSDQRPDLGNPHGNAYTVGSAQMDSFKAHSHTGSTLGGNPMSFRLVHGGGPDTHSVHATGYTGAAGFTDHASAEYPNSSHTHGLAINEAGEAETCPRCVIVNTFIKVNRTPNNQATNIIIEAVQGIPALITRGDRFITAVRNAVIQIMDEERVRRQNAFR